jgi:hypothetical protein
MEQGKRGKCKRKKDSKKKKHGQVGTETRVKWKGEMRAGLDLQLI